MINCAWKDDQVLDSVPKVVSPYASPRAKAANLKQAVDRATSSVGTGASFAQIMLALAPDEMRALGAAGFNREQIEAMHASGLLSTVVDSLAPVDPTQAVS